MKKKILFQVGFWIIVFVINLGFLRGVDEFGEDLGSDIIDLVFYMAIFYLNILVIFPKYYETNRTIYVVVSIFILVFSIAALHNLSELILLAQNNRRGWSFSLIVQPLWLVMVYLSGSIYSVQELLNKQVITNKAITEEKLQTELQLLKNQINPHFLFNALNNIYSLTYSKSEKAPESVLKLSDMLRYVIEDCSNENVTIENEINYITNLVDFYKMKIQGARKVGFIHDIRQPGLSIAPMLFIPFIENGFKYSRIDEDSDGYIQITLKEHDRKVLFTIRNSVFKERKILPGSKKGISNVKQRLEIIYPNRHSLTMNDKGHEFFVELQIDLT